MKKRYIAPHFRSYSFAPTAILAGSPGLDNNGSNKSVENPTAESKGFNLGFDLEDSED